MMNKQYLKDTLAFVRYIHNDENKSDKAKYLALVSTLGHDLNGLINEDPFFRPRVSGYAQSARAVHDAERLDNE
jgi:hypothetical protein